MSAFMRRETDPAVLVGEFERQEIDTSAHGFARPKLRRDGAGGRG